MFLPNRHNAYIEIPKLTYLLDHPSKAGWLLLMGFSWDSAHILKDGLLWVGRTQPVIEIESTPYGVKYVVEGYIQNAKEVLWPVRVVWIVDTGQTAPRFVTARPIKK